MNDMEFRQVMDKLRLKGASSREQLKKLFKLNKDQKEILDLYIELEKYWADKNGYERGQINIRQNIKNILDISNTDY
jgi:hypothetical protein